MAVFVSASDESAGKDSRDLFVFAGWLGPEEDWFRFFAPAWDERVLAGPPRIPYIHMTELRSRPWREKYGISMMEADRRLNEACCLIDQMATLQPLRVIVDAGDIKDAFHRTEIRSSGKQFSRTDFEPDYICFFGYAFAVLSYLKVRHPEAEKVDFVIERKNTVTRYIQEFYSQFPAAFSALGSPELVPLMGELIPGDKNRVPLQAADVLCWHCAKREKLETMTADDAMRYRKIAMGKGGRIRLSTEQIFQIKNGIFPVTAP